jgi:hypothetical protein
LSEQVLRSAAGPVVFERGRDYADEGLVDLLAVGEDHVSATVHGSEEYAVDLADDDGVLTWVCTCPYAEDGSFCKHLVAAGLAAGEQEGVDGLPEPPVAAAVSDADLRAWLGGHRVGELVELLMAAAERDGELRRDLELRLAAERGLAPDLRRYDAALASAFDTGGFVGWREMYDWTGDVDAAIDGLVELLDAGFAEAAATLAERAFTYLEGAYGHVDDSAGQLVEIAERLVDVHLSALEAADECDRVAVGRRLVDLAVACELDPLRERLGDYRQPLGTDGWAALREAADELWAGVPPRAPGDDEPDRYGRRLRLVQIMEALAGDDLQALLDIRARSLAHPYDWVRIVELCASAGRDDLAVDWGERGLAAFGEDTDARLVDVVSDVYVRTGRPAEAVELERRRFHRAPSTAGTSGCGRPPGRRAAGRPSVPRPTASRAPTSPPRSVRRPTPSGATRGGSRRARCSCRCCSATARSRTPGTPRWPTAAPRRCGWSSRGCGPTSTPAMRSPCCAATSTGCSNPPATTPTTPSWTSSAPWHRCTTAPAAPRSSPPRRRDPIGLQAPPQPHRPPRPRGAVVGLDRRLARHCRGIGRRRGQCWSA